MRSLKSHRFGTTITFLSLLLIGGSTLPEMRCASDTCVAQVGSVCWNDGQPLLDYKTVIGFDS